MTGRPTPVRDAVLATLAQGPLTAPELAVATGYGRNSIEKAIRHLDWNGRIRQDGTRLSGRTRARVWALPAGQEARPCT